MMQKKSWVYFLWGRKIKGKWASELDKSGEVAHSSVSAFNTVSRYTSAVILEAIPLTNYNLVLQSQLNVLNRNLQLINLKNTTPTANFNIISSALPIYILVS